MRITIPKTTTKMVIRTLVFTVKMALVVRVTKVIVTCNNRNDSEQSNDTKNHSMSHSLRSSHPLNTCHDRIDSIDIDLSIRFPAIYGDPPSSHPPTLPTLPPSHLPGGWEGGYGNGQVRFDRLDGRSDSMPVFAVGWLGMLITPSDTPR